MKNFCLSFFFLIIAIASSQAQNKDQEIRILSEYSSQNPEIRDILQFEGIEYIKLQFIGKELSNKHYHLSVKEIWDGKVVRDSTIFNSKTIEFEQFQTVGDTILKLKVISKLTEENKLKMTFSFPRFGLDRVFDAIDSDDYSLRFVAKSNNSEIAYGKKFYLLAYILPYENEAGYKSWCDVESSGKEIETWGTRFGIKHYLVFEMEFE